MVISLKKIGMMAAIVSVFAACKKDKDPVFVVAPSGGSQVQFGGIAGTEAGSSAGNSVYLDLSSNTTTPVKRSGWDLAFYCGNEFRVALNNTTGAAAKVLAKNDLTTVDAADTVGLTLAIDPFNPSPADYAYFDNLDGSVTGTVIPEVSATDNDNKVIIINRGAGGGIPGRPWIKLRVLRNGNNGYTVQFANIRAGNFKTVQVSKDNAYHYVLFSFEGGKVLTQGQPEKNRWDLVWSYSLFQTVFPINTVPTAVPYNFADMIAVNNLSNVQVKEKTYADAATATAAYAAFNRDSVNATINAVVPGRWTIGSGWRSTQPATGVNKNRFYIIKDGTGNYYKFKCVAMGVGGDGGTRGKPEFKYDLIP
jgi:hypothetical protein